MDAVSFRRLRHVREFLAGRVSRRGCTSFTLGRSGAAAKRPHTSRLLLEVLERRDTPSTFDLSVDPQQIPLGPSKPGETVTVKVNLTIDQADPNDPSEGEGFATAELEGPGFSETISDYGITEVPIAITEANEEITAYLIEPPNAEGDEGTATVETLPTADVQVAGPGSEDNITLYNAANNPFLSFFGFGGSLEATQTVPVTITNTGDTSGTFDLMVDAGSGGSGTLSPSSVTLDPGEEQTVTFTPTQVSTEADDVHILAQMDGATVGEDDMTVVSVTFDPNIHNTDTPQQMLDQKAYRIPPTKDTQVHVVVTPNLEGSNEEGQVALTITGSDDSNNGSAKINNSSDPFQINKEQDVQLQGDAQTAPGTFHSILGFGYFTGLHAGNLHLAVQVRGEDTDAQSNGFSVSALPGEVSFTDAGQIFAPPAWGLLAHYSVKSDSGDPNDLSAILISEQVQPDVANCTGVFATNNHSNNSGYLTAAAMVAPGTLDHHQTGTDRLLVAPHFGNRVAQQTFTFRDLRTGVTDIPEDNSGFLITYTANFDPTDATGRTLILTTTKVGHDETANGFASAAGTGYAFHSQLVLLPATGHAQAWRQSVVSGIVVGHVTPPKHVVVPHHPTTPTPPKKRTPLLVSHGWQG
jgi:hypothetical protein